MLGYTIITSLSYHRNKKTQGITTTEISIIRFNGFIVFANHLKPRRVEFLRYILKK